MWGNADSKTPKSSKYGKGNVLSGMTMQEALDYIKVIPDVLLTNKDVLYAHRTTKDGDIYFLTNQTNKTINLSPAFRITGKQPELWDAVTGDTRDLTSI